MFAPNLSARATLPRAHYGHATVEAEVTALRASNARMQAEIQELHAAQQLRQSDLGKEGQDGGAVGAASCGQGGGEHGGQVREDPDNGRRHAQQLRQSDHVLPSALASSAGAKQLVWRNCENGKWTSLCCTATAPESASVWASLCAMDASSAADSDGDGAAGLGLEWQEALPVVKRLRLQLRRLQQKGQQKKLDGAPQQQPASSLAPTASCDTSAQQHDPPTSNPGPNPDTSPS